MSKKVQRKCSTCKWLRPNDDGRKFHHSKVYACTYLFPPMEWPQSMSRNRHDSAIREVKRPVKGWMQPGDGKDCPCWEIVF